MRVVVHSLRYLFFLTGHVLSRSQSIEASREVEVLLIVNFLTQNHRTREKDAQWGDAKWEKDVQLPNWPSNLSRAKSYILRYSIEYK